jgi:hypothetical protein
MRRVLLSVLLAAGCNDAPREAVQCDAAVAPVLDGAADVAPRCSPAEYDAGLEAALPAWATGFFFAEPPTGGSDALDLRLGPGLEFELAVTGCDVVGTTRGEARVDDAGVWLLPASGKSTFDWPTDLSLGESVQRVALAPRPDGRLVATSDAGVSSWSAGLSCGCGGFRACGCDDPFQ